MQNNSNSPATSGIVKKFLNFSFTLYFIMCASTLIAQNSSTKKQIYLDIAHGQKFYNDPADMKGQDQDFIERVKYMTGEIKKNASPFNADLNFLKEEIKPELLKKCDLLFIHMPSAKYSPGEVKAIKEYLNNGGSLFIVMDVDYWSTLEQSNVNDLVSPFGIQYGNDSPDTVTGGYTKANLLTKKPLKITYHGGRIVKGGIPFCFIEQDEEQPFGTFAELKNGGKIVAMGDGMVSLYMTSWQGVNDYQCGEFMNDVFSWLLK